EGAPVTTAADAMTPRNLGGTSGVGGVSVGTLTGGTYLAVIRTSLLGHPRRGPRSVWTNRRSECGLVRSAGDRDGQTGDRPANRVHLRRKAGGRGAGLRGKPVTVGLCGALAGQVEGKEDVVAGVHGWAPSGSRAIRPVDVSGSASPHARRGCAL